MSVWLIAFEKIDFKQIAQTNLGRPLRSKNAKNIDRCYTKVLKHIWSIDYDSKSYQKYNFDVY